MEEEQHYTFKVGRPNVYGTPIVFDPTASPEERVRTYTGEDNLFFTLRPDGTYDVFNRGGDVVPIPGRLGPVAIRSTTTPSLVGRLRSTDVGLELVATEHVAFLESSSEVGAKRLSEDAFRWRMFQQWIVG